MASQSHIKPAPEPSAEDFRRKSKGIFIVAAAAGVIGLIVALVLGYVEHGHDPDHPDYFRRFYFAYLTSFAFFLAIGLGSIFFTLMQFLVRAGWSVQVRRVAENLMMTVPVLGILSLPILVSVVIQKGDLYRWALPKDAVAAEHGASKEHSGAKVAGGHSVGVTPAEAGGTGPTLPEAGEAHGAPPKKAAHDAEGKPAEGDAAEGEGEGHDSQTERPFHLDEITIQKRAWLNPWFWLIRVVLYFTIWSALAIYYRRHSVAQDVDGDLEHTAKLQKFSAPGLVILGITLTFGAFDIFMSLDPHWFSTMFGVYYFAGCALSLYATLIILVTLVRRAGFLTGVTKDHYHDMSKFQFGFTFFWGYIAFSQFMLLWYANLPETTPWFSRRGATTAVVTPADLAAAHGDAQLALSRLVADQGHEWRPVAFALLFGHLLIPFAGLLSRHVKRRVSTAVFWACWALFFHFLNMYWVVMPEMHTGFHLHLIDLACFVGLLGVFAATFIKVTGTARLLPVHDPRLSESLAFTNI